MMNIVKLQDQLKNFSQEQLISAMQMPDGSTPQYLVLGEIMRRKQMETAAAGQPAPESTVAEDAVAAAGVPQGGIADMARALAPKTDMAQNTGIQAMASGGPVKKMAAGDAVDRKPPAYLTDETLRIMANRQGMSVDEYLTSVGPERAADIIADVQRRTAGQNKGVIAAFNENLPVRGTQTGLDEFYPSFGQVKSEALAELGANPTRSFGGADQYDQGMPELLTARQTFAQENPFTPDVRGGPDDFRVPPARPSIFDEIGGTVSDITKRYNAEVLRDSSDFRAPAPYAMPLTADEQAMSAFGVPASGRELPGMNTREEALAIALAKPPGTGGARDALIASGTPGKNIAALLPRPEDLIAPARPASSGPQGSKAQYLLGQPEYQVAAENRMPEGQPAAGTPALSEAEKARAAGRDSFSVGEVLADLGISVDLSGTGQRAVPGPGRSPVPASKEAAAAQRSSDAYQQMADTMKEAGIASLAGDKLAPAAAPAAAADDAKPVAETTPQGGRTGGTSGGTGGGGAGGVSSYEQQLMDALASREKAAKQDKWLALAQVGLNLMSSKEPTLLGAVGEAGLKGVEAARTARDQYDKDKLELQGALEKSRMARAAASARTAAGASAGSAPAVKPVSSAILNQYVSNLDSVNEQLNQLGEPPEPGWWSGTIDDPVAAERAQLQSQADQLKAAISYGYATHGMPYLDAGTEYDADVSD